MNLHDKKITNLDIFWAMLKKHPRLLSANMVFLIFTGLVESSSVITLAPIIDIYTKPNLVGASAITVKLVQIVEKFGIAPTIIHFCAIFLGFIVLKNIFLLISRYLMLRSKYTVMKTVIMGSYTTIFNSDWNFFTSRKPGELLNTFTREVLRVADSIGVISDLMLMLVRFIFYIAVPFLIGPKLTLIVLSMLAVIYIPSLIIGKITRVYGEKDVSTANSFTATLTESFQAVKTILGFGKIQQSIKVLGHDFDQHQEVTIKWQLLNHLNHAFYEPLMTLILFFSMYLSATVMGSSISDSLVIIYALRNALPLFSQFVVNRNSLEGLIPSYEQVLRLEKEAIANKQTSGKINFTGFKNKICFKKVSFSYGPGNPQALKNITLEIPKGKMVAFVGKSGAGKSTLIDLLMGFHKPDGSIYFDETPLTDYDIFSYRNHIGPVPQDSFLFNYSLKDNLKWSNSDASDQEIRQACALANAEEFIQKLEFKYDTIVGERGVKLSGGQRQRIALARAILRKPDLLILDEATSALDSESEKLIQEAIEKISKKTTIIVIAHRLSTIVKADIIYVLDEGQLVEQGNFTQLLAKEGTFYQLAKLQGL